MSFRKCKLTFLTRNIAHAEFRCGRNVEKNTSSVTRPYSGLQPSIRLSEFYLHCFRLQVLLPIELKIGDWLRNERETELDVLQAKLLI